MSAHLAIERLSAYLDDELDGEDSRQVESHVVECPHCQHRLRGLRRVVDELQRMPTAAPPPTLGRTLDRAASARWRARRDEAFRGKAQSGFEIVQGLIQLSSAMVVAVATIALVIAYGMARDSAGGTRLVLPAAGAIEPSAERVEAGGRLFVLSGGVWWQQDLLAAGEVAPEVGARSRQEVLARAPWLAELLRRGPVVLELDGVPVLVETAASGR